MVARINGPVRGINYTKKTLGELYRWLFADIFRLKIMPKETSEFMRNLIKKIIEQRERSNVKENDAIDLLYSLHKSSNPITFDEVWANSTALLMAGHDNTSSAIRHTLYELSKREDLQERCRVSIRDAMKKHKIKSEKDLTYEAVMDMQFIEQCVFGMLSDMMVFMQKLTNLV